MLINCVAYQAGRRLAEIDKREISDYVARQDCFVWVAVKDRTEAERAQMQEEFGLHELAVEDARHGHQRPKIEEYADALFVVLSIIEVAGDELNIGEMSVFVGKNYIRTVRQRAERGFQEVRARCEREPELLSHGSGYVLYVLMDAVVDRYFPVLEAVETKLEAAEEQLFVRGSARINIEELYYVKQKLTTLKHAAAPLLETSGKLLGGPVPPVCTGLREYFRYVYDHLLLLNESIPSLRDNVTTSIPVDVAMITYGETEGATRRP